MATKGHDGEGEFSQVVIEDVRDNGVINEKVGTGSDAKDMHRMGKTQELRRNFSFFPIFGFAAVLMVTWEAVLSAASYALPNGGRPALIWTFVFSMFGFGAAILSMAEMASMAPTSGGQYHWVSEFAPKTSQKILSYIIGWFCVLGWQAGVAGQSFSVGLQIQGLIALNDETYVPQNWHSTLLAIAAVSVCVVFNTFFARKLPLVEGLVMVLHVLGFFAILIPLWIFAPKAPSSEVWGGLQNNAGWSSTGLAFLVGMTSAVNALIGPDSAVHMSEEIRDASRVLPRAMLWTLVVNGLAGLIMSITFAYCLGPLDASLDPPYFFAFIGTFYTATQSKAGATVMSCIITILTLCSAISNVATSSRQMFAFARDRGLPFGSWLSHVRPGWDIPLHAVFTTFFIACLLCLINLGSSVAFNAILSIGVVSLLSSYLVSISCVLIKRIRGQPLLPRRWSLGKWGYAMNVIGLAYLMIAYLFAFFPLGTPVKVATMNWACVAYGGVGIVATIYYFLYAKNQYVAPVSRLAKDL
ncbi:hypothetical protein LTR36_002052 [Oleoguttula mirabilis]|uniref:Amino acid transporter n=1 Tax=Oleoguttula mirabilis TaxID=1507867 RepID=A0AAV9JM00_9PEZI|nr:hypothetical protein LTR36_002052 [Oleoguttula mirabilis]